MSTIQPRGELLADPEPLLAITDWPFPDVQPRSTEEAKARQALRRSPRLRQSRIDEGATPHVPSIIPERGTPRHRKSVTRPDRIGVVDRSSSPRSRDRTKAKSDARKESSSHRRSRSNIEDALQSWSSWESPSDETEVHWNFSDVASDDTSKSPWHNTFQIYEEFQMNNMFMHRHLCSIAPDLYQHTKAILARTCESPRISDEDFEAFKRVLDDVWDRPEAEMIDRISHIVIAAKRGTLDGRLEKQIDRLWFRALAVPPVPNDSNPATPLTQPKPDLAFGYSPKAFTMHQRQTINSNLSYVQPSKNMAFPFLVIEFKAQPTRGSHFQARLQTANAGARALHGFNELTRRIPGLKVFGPHQVHFFSLSMDDELAKLYGHWHQPSGWKGQHEFHSALIARYALDVVEDLRAVQAAVANIIEHALAERLPLICQALDALGELE